MRISDWSSDVCSSDLKCSISSKAASPFRASSTATFRCSRNESQRRSNPRRQASHRRSRRRHLHRCRREQRRRRAGLGLRSEEHTSELQSLMRISYAVFCLQKKKAYPENKSAAPVKQHKNQTEQHNTEENTKPTQ